jgi:hypothetical protein
VRYDITTASSAKTLLDGLFSARNYGIRHHGGKLDERESAVKRSRAITEIVEGGYFDSDTGACAPSIIVLSSKANTQI